MEFLNDYNFDDKPDKQPTQSQSCHKPIIIPPAVNGNKSQCLEDSQSKKNDSGNEKITKEPMHHFHRHVHVSAIRSGDQKNAAQKTANRFITENKQKDDTLPGSLNRLFLSHHPYSGIYS